MYQGYAGRTRKNMYKIIMQNDRNSFEAFKSGEHLNAQRKDFGKKYIIKN